MACFFCINFPCSITDKLKNLFLLFAGHIVKSVATLLDSNHLDKDGMMALIVYNLLATCIIIGACISTKNLWLHPKYITLFQFSCEWAASINTISHHTHEAIMYMYMYTVLYFRISILWFQWWRISISGQELSLAALHPTDTDQVLSLRQEWLPHQGEIRHSLTTSRWSGIWTDCTQLYQACMTL